jgi:hypothetical protein
VYRGDDEVARVDRNFGSFPYEFLVGAEDGEDYLICGFDYQGYTVVRLSDGEQVDFLSEAANDGHGFCIALMQLSPCKQFLVMEGCYWGCPYQVRMYDVSEPLNVPWPVIFESGLDPTEGSWQEDGSFTWKEEDAIYHKEYEAFVLDLEGEQDLAFNALNSACWEDYLDNDVDSEEAFKSVKAVTEERERVCVWRPSDMDRAAQMIQYLREWVPSPKDKVPAEVREQVAAQWARMDADERARVRGLIGDRLDLCGPEGAYLS